MKYSVILLSILLSSCSYESGKVDPKLLSQEKYTSKDIKQVALGEKITGDWWELFKSDELNKLIKEGFENNYTIVAAKARLAQAEHALRAAEGQWLPKIGLDASISRQQYGVAQTGPTPQKVPIFKAYSLGPNASLPLDLFGRTSNSIKEQEALARYQYYELQAAYLTLSSHIVGQALKLASANAQIKIVQELIANDQKYLKLTKASLSNGTATKLDLLNAERQLNNDQSMLPSIEQQASLAQHALALLLGKTPIDWQVPKLSLNKFKLPSKLPIALPSELIHQRPDILAAEAQWNASIAGVGVATANMFPNINITASISQQSLTLDSLFKSSSSAWGLAGNIMQPIFAGGMLEAKRQAAIDAEQVMLAMYQQTILSAFCQIADLLHAVQNSNESLAIQKSNLDIANKQLSLVTFKHDNGNAGMLEILDAKRLNYNAKLGMQRMMAQYYVDIAQLFEALGNSKPLANMSDSK